MPKPIFDTDQQWMDTIHACRVSGMTDREWCFQHGISTTSLYRHIRKLRSRNISVPEHGALCTSEKHEVVPLRIVDPEKAETPVSGPAGIPFIQEENTGGLRISIGSFHIDVANDTAPSILQNTLSILQKLC